MNKLISNRMYLKSQYGCTRTLGFSNPLPPLSVCNYGSASSLWFGCNSTPRRLRPLWSPSCSLPLSISISRREIGGNTCIQPQRRFHDDTNTTDFFELYSNSITNSNREELPSLTNKSLIRRREKSSSYQVWV